MPSALIKSLSIKIIENLKSQTTEIKEKRLYLWCRLVGEHISESVFAVLDGNLEHFNDRGLRLHSARALFMPCSAPLWGNTSYSAECEVSSSLFYLGIPEPPSDKRKGLHTFLLFPILEPYGIHWIDMCINNQNKPEPDTVSWEKLVTKLENCDFDNPEYESWIKASASGFGSNRIASSNMKMPEGLVKTIQIRLAQYAGVDTVKLSFERIPKNELSKPFSRFKTEKVWTVILDMSSVLDVN